MPLSLAELRGQPPQADEMVVWDDNGAGIGSLIAVSEGAEATQPFRPELTPAGVRSPVLSLDDDPVENLRVWKNLPEIYWNYPVTKLKPAAEAYLVHPRATTNDGKPMPLLAAHYYGKGYVLYCGFDETWRWRFNEADRFFGRYWSQHRAYDGAVLDAQASSDGATEGSITIPGGKQILFRVYSLALADPADLAAQGLSPDFNKYVRNNQVPGAYVAVIAPGGSHWLGRSGPEIPFSMDGTYRLLCS